MDDWTEEWNGDTLFIRFHETPDRDMLDAVIAHYTEQDFEYFRILSGTDSGDLRTSEWVDLDSWDTFGDDMEAYAESHGGVHSIAFSG